MATLEDTIVLLKVSKRSATTQRQRLDALLAMLRAANNGRVDLDAIEVLFDAGLSLENRRSLVDQLEDGLLTMEQVEQAVERAKKPHQTRAKAS